MSMLEKYYTNEAYEWLRQAIGISDCNFDVVQMKGSTSSSVFLIRCLHNLNPQRFVLRVLDNQQWLVEEPDLAEHEASALEEAQKTGLPVPRLVAYSSSDVGFGVPVVLMSYLEGNVELRPANFKQWLNDLADQLALLHQHPADTFPWHWQSWVEKTALVPPKWTRTPHIWEQAIDIVLGSKPAEQAVFVHRDYHPANILWCEGRVSGIVDWINACQGAAGVDVAHCRTNLALMFDFTAADQFLDAYTANSTQFNYNPYWDLDSILDMCLPQPSFYKPWQEFGLSVIPSETLKQRIDVYLESVMKRI